jgi:hypothetical protein
MLDEREIGGMNLKANALPLKTLILQTTRAEHSALMENAYLEPGSNETEKRLIDFGIRVQIMMGSAHELGDIDFHVAHLFGACQPD